MLFEPKIDPRCVYCARGNAIDEEQFLCVKKGVVSGGDHCRAFRYDPLRRVPPKPLPTQKAKIPDEDFSL